ncbi:MAG: pilus assembly protein N-terminal domain-containing protein [Planctomycetota bacterium]|nr:pilus assembly protein N-terminal domain-containing protein [Planctomycetota bacterium]MDA1179123.1 pilus assembly protein N-terminal domain-containing protein [Planctomycetota bacterium]
MDAELSLLGQLSRKLAAALLIFTGFVANAGAQLPGHDPVKFRVDAPSQRLEMVANSSRILTLDKEIPRVLVNNTSILRVVPLSPTQVQVSALKPGVTAINLWDEEGKVYSVDVLIMGDARELELLLQTQFPHSAIRVRPTASSVILTGTVDRPEVVSRIIRMAEDYYPKVINNISVGGVQQVLLHVQVMEISRTKLRSFGFDWAQFGAGGSIVQDASQLISAFSSTAQSVTAGNNATVQFGLFNGTEAFFGVLEALREYNLVKVMAEPTLVTVSGRPASFQSGGEFPILVPQSLGTVSIEFKTFGTRVDFVPIVQGNGRIRLEVRPYVSEIDNARGVTVNGERIPGLRTRWVDTAVEMGAGQTLALAGLIQDRTETINRGIPFLADLPWVGAAFRRVAETTNEVELLVMVRPELVDGLDPHEVPPCGPGETNTNPNHLDFYWRGYMEVPRCCEDGSCEACQSGTGSSGALHGATTLPSMQLPPNAVPGSIRVMPQGNGSPESIQPEGVPYSEEINPTSLQQAYPGTRSVMVRPASASLPVMAESVNRSGPQNQSNPFVRTQRPVQQAASLRAANHGMIGPSGYDDLDFNRKK